jgi:hypothetical protein
LPFASRTIVSFLILMADRLSYGAAWAFLGKSLAALGKGEVRAISGLSDRLG